MTIAVSEVALADIDNIPVKTWRQLKRKLEQGSGQKPLTGPYAGLFRVRVGDWRAVIDPIRDDVILVLVVAHRSEVYDILGQRVS